MRQYEQMKYREQLPETTIKALNTLAVMDAPYDPEAIDSLHPGWCTGIGQLYFFLLHAPQLAKDLNLEAFFVDEDQQTFLGDTEVPFPSMQRTFPIVKTPISPGSLLNSFLDVSVTAPYTISHKSVTPDIITNAFQQPEGKWLLCGAIGPKSIISLLAALNRNGFCGQVDVVDSNPSALIAFEAVRELIKLKYPNISINFIEGNLLQCSIDIEPHCAYSVGDNDDNQKKVFLSTKYYDGITADTIGTYIVDDSDLITHFSVIFESLRDGGVAFVRDMTEGPESMKVSCKHVDPMNRKNEKGVSLHNYIQALLGKTVPVEYCTAVVEKFFSDTQANRWSYLVDLWTVVGPAHLSAMRQFAVPNATVQQRYFADLLFIKD